MGFSWASSVTTTRAVQWNAPTQATRLRPKTRANVNESFVCTWCNPNSAVAEVWAFGTAALPAHGSLQATVADFGTYSEINVLALAQTGNIKQAVGETAVAQAGSLQLRHSQRSGPAAGPRAALWYTAGSDKLPIGKGRMDGDLVTHYSVPLNPSSRGAQIQEGPLMYVFRRARMKKLLKCL